ncbi:MAG: Re/Si-specific NAD(P)(+) transhydrogenase subunit alpha [Proteobacteria bacterium]|nr:Re/Si-specific NAD(P)(+) transhydrogenase subunit alpha [Pseudomonadota bacterium]
MRISVVKETAEFEKRVALTPDMVKRLCDGDHEVIVEKGAGEAAGFSDNDYKVVGAKIGKAFADTVKGAQVVLKVGELTEKQLPALDEKTAVIAMHKPHDNKKLFAKIAKQNITAFALEFVPRITRAQSMDVLSSQSNLAGYRAVVEAAYEFDRAFPLMMTAAGTVTAARVLIIGAGVAGLQAIATARRMGAIVSAFDVRAAAKEQVESLGASFVEVESKESGEGSGGYAKEMSEAYKKAQAEKLHEVLKTQDIVITTALIPGKPAPILISEKMVADMKVGSVIVDLAIEAGGNCALSKPGISFTKNGVKIVAHPNMPSRIAYNASQLYAKNVFNFLSLMIDKESKALKIDFDDEIIKSACLCHNGKLVHDIFKS